MSTRFLWVVVFISLVMPGVAHAQRALHLRGLDVDVAIPAGAGEWRTAFDGSGEHPIDELHRTAPAEPQAVLRFLPQSRSTGCDLAAEQLDGQRPARLATRRYDARAQVRQDGGVASVILCAPVPDGIVLAQIMYGGDLASDDFAGLAPVLDAVVDALHARGPSAAAASGPLRLGTLDGVELAPPPGPVRWAPAPSEAERDTFQGVGPSGPSLRVTVRAVDGGCAFFLYKLQAVSRTKKTTVPVPAHLGDWHPLALQQRDGEGIAADLCMELGGGRALVVWVYDGAGKLTDAEPLVIAVAAAARRAHANPGERGKIELGYRTKLELPAPLSWKRWTWKSARGFAPVGPGAPPFELLLMDAEPLTCPQYLTAVNEAFPKARPTRLAGVLGAGWGRDALVEDQGEVRVTVVCASISPNHSMVAIVSSPDPMDPATADAVDELLGAIAEAYDVIPPAGFVNLRGMAIVLTPEDMTLGKSYGATFGSNFAFVPREAFDLSASGGFELGYAAGGFAMDLKSAAGLGSKRGPFSFGVHVGLGLDGYGIWGDGFRLPFGGYLLAEAMVRLRVGPLQVDASYGKYPRTGANETRSEVRAAFFRPDRTVWWLGVKHMKLDDAGAHGEWLGAFLGFSPSFR